MPDVTMRALFGRPVRLLGNDELIVRERGPNDPAILGGGRANVAAIDDDAETGSALERNGQELEQLGIVARDHYPITGHAVTIISVDSASRTRAHQTSPP
jgi:hypothetical protein